MSLFSDLISTLFEKRYRNLFLENAHDKSIVDLAKDLLGSYGEVSGGALAHMIFDKYAKMDPVEKKVFFHHFSERRRSVPLRRKFIGSGSSRCVGSSHACIDPTQTTRNQSF